MRVVSQVDLPPGRYQVRVAVGEEGGRGGSVLYDLEVPDFYRAPLTMSGVALTVGLGAADADGAAEEPAGRLSSRLRRPPRASSAATTSSRCSPSSTRTRPARRRTASTSRRRVRDDAGRVVTQNTDERSSTELQGPAGRLRLHRSHPATHARARHLRDPGRGPQPHRRSRQCDRTGRANPSSMIAASFTLANHGDTETRRHRGPFGPLAAARRAKKSLCDTNTPNLAFLTKRRVSVTGVTASLETQRGQGRRVWLRPWPRCVSVVRDQR